MEENCASHHSKMCPPLSRLGQSRPIQPILPAVHVRFAPKATDVLRCREWCDVPLSDIAPRHSITSSALARNDSGTASPSPFAVLRLTTSSNLVGCSIGRSDGLAPRKSLTSIEATSPL